MKKLMRIFFVAFLLPGGAFAEEVQSAPKQDVPVFEFPVYLHGSGIASKDPHNAERFEAQNRFVELYLIPLRRINDINYVSDKTVRLNLANLMRGTEISAETDGFGGVDAFLADAKSDLDAHLNHLKEWVHQGVILALVGDAGAQIKAPNGMFQSHWQLPTAGPYNQQAGTIQLFTSAAMIYSCGSQEVCSFPDDFPLDGAGYDSLRTWANDTNVSTVGYGDALGGRALVLVNASGSRTLWAEIFDKETGATKFAWGHKRYKDLMPRHAMGEYKTFALPPIPSSR